MFALPPRRLVREGVPIAAILLFWYLLGAVAAGQGLGGPVSKAGVVMATLYVVVRGVGLSSAAVPPTTGDLEGVLAENARIAVPAGVWFLGGILAAAVGSSVAEFPWVTTAVGSALAGAGLGVVGLYAVAAGTAALGGGRAGGGATADQSGVSSGDD